MGTSMYCLLPPAIIILTYSDSFAFGLKDVDCGYPGINEGRCSELGCCWNPIKNSFPCFICAGRGSYTQSSSCTFANPSARRQCGGSKSISKEECESLGCCFDNRLRSMVKRCFFKASESNQPYCYYNDKGQREDCGWPGIHPDSCLDLECCSDMSTPNTAHCYFRRGGNKSESSDCKFGGPKDRSMCGYSGINQLDCEEIGCCFDNRVRGGGIPQCFGERLRPTITPVTTSTEIIEEPPSPPSIISFTMSKDVFEENDNASVKCKFSSNQTTAVEWDFDGRILETMPLNNAVSLKYYSVITNFTSGESILSFHEITLRATGNYTCRVRNRGGVVEDSIFVTANRVQLKSTTKYNTNIIIPPETGWSTSDVVTGAVATLLSFIVILFASLYGYKRYLITVLGRRDLTVREAEEFFEGSPKDVRNDQTYINPWELPYDEKAEIDQKRLRIDLKNVLGMGHFGRVYLGRLLHGGTTLALSNGRPENEYQNSPMDTFGNGRYTIVAVKTVGSQIDAEYFKTLLSEIKVMNYIGKHENIIHFIGACTKNIRKRDVYIIAEYCPQGNLATYIEKHKDRFVNVLNVGAILKKESSLLSQPEWGSNVFSTHSLLGWTRGIATGLEYIHSKNVIHGDLATRNILLTENGIPKISDFGLARQLAASESYMKKTQVPLPWRHMAPESLNERRFSHKSDIWAFGVTLWEIYSLGKVPYGGTNWSVEFSVELENGIRLPMPSFAPKEIYNFMKSCWTINEECRPPASYVVPIFNKLCEDE